MRKMTVLLCAAMLLFGMLGSASAYTSTFDVAGDFSLTGFSNSAQPTAGPDTLTVTNPTGSYSLDIPPAGTYDWYVSFNSLTLDFFGDGTPELAFLDKGPYFVGTYATPTPGLTGSYNFGDVYIPEYSNSGITVGGYTLLDLNVDWGITMTQGGDITEIELLITADNLLTLNEELTWLDNQYGGSNGIIDGYATADFSVTAAPVPEPATFILLGSGLAGLAFYRRKKK